MLRFLTLPECGERVRFTNTLVYQSSHVGNGEYSGSYFMDSTQAGFR